MKIKALLFLTLMVLSARVSMLAKAEGARSPGGPAALNSSPFRTGENIFDLTAFGAAGDGVADDGPALQNALNAIAEAGGGTLFVPAGRYAIITPVRKDFTGLASAVTILGVESSTPVPPPTAPGRELNRGLDLVSEFAPKTGAQQVTINITGLQSFLIKDIAFIGTPDVTTDALITLALNDIWEATIRHCEFYGLSSLVEGGAIVQAVRSNLTMEQSVVLGSTCSSGVYSSIVQNIEWKGITVRDTVFVDYGQRPELYGKMNYAAPLSWINIGNAAALTNDSPRREAVIRNVFLDEGGFVGLTSLPYRYQPPSAPIDLVYITGLYMNVSNLGTSGHYFYGLQRLLIENSHYGWSHNTDSAINLLGTQNAILDGVVTEASATRIRADATTGKLTVINSIYEDLASQAQTTRVITTETPEDDPVQYVRQQFVGMLGREPDAAAHFYWADRLLQCEEDTQCAADERAALDAYLNSAPSANFSISGQVTDENGASLSGVTVTLSGSQSVTTSTDAEGQYRFSNLPTSGVYTVTASKTRYTFGLPRQTFDAPVGDQVVDFAATLNRHSISGNVADANGNPVASVTVSLSGTQSGETTTNASGDFSFANLPAGGNYTVVVSKTHYTFSPDSTFEDLGADRTANFTATLNRHTIRGRAAQPDGSALAGASLTLSGTQTATATTDANGAYTLTNLPAGGNYTVKPSKTSYSWAPQSLAFNDLGSDQTGNFTGTFVTYTISGRVKENGVGLGGVSVMLSGSQTASATTDPSGGYSFSVPSEGSYIITLSKMHYSFAPESLSFNNLNANQTADLAATLHRHSISGRVANTNNYGIAGVSLALSGSQAATATTDTNGDFSFANLPAGGTYTVTPSLAYHSFNVPSQTYNDLDADQYKDFVATLNTHTVSGRVTKDGAGFAGATVTLSWPQNSTTTVTDANGNYSFGNVLAGGNYTVTVTKTNCTFAPPSQTYNDLNANQSNSFVGTLNTHTVSGRVTKDGAGFAGATVTLWWSQNSTTTVTDANGSYSFGNVLAGGNYTVTVTKTNRTFAPSSQSFNNLGSNQTANFIAFFNPMLMTVENSERAIAFESVTFFSDPFSVVARSTFASDQRTRIIFFAMNIDLQSGEPPSAITAFAEDSQHRIFPVTVEYVERVPNMNWLMQVNLILPDQIAEGGDLWISLNFHGLQSNKALITIKPS